MFGLKLSLLFVAVISITSADDLTPEENEKLQKTCGRQKLPPLQRKSFGGRQMKVNEASWSAALWHQNMHACSSTLISPRHLLTAAHCVVFDRENKSSTLVGISKAKFGNDCVSFSDCMYTSKSNPYVLRKVTFPSLYLDDENRHLDIAILELDRNVPEADAEPLCIAKKDANVPKFLFGVGYGRDEKNVNNSDSLQSYNLTFKFDTGDLIYESINYTQNIDLGDSGSGGLQIRKDGAYEIIGVLKGMRASAKDVLEKKHLGYNGFVDVRKLSDWICIYSGICPNENREQTMKYRMFLPEASINHMKSTNSGNAFPPVLSANCRSTTAGSSIKSKKS